MARPVLPGNQNAIFNLAHFGQVHFDTIDSEGPLLFESQALVAATYTIPFEASGFGGIASLDCMFYVTINRGQRVVTLTPLVNPKPVPA